jgi:REP element-mobilizing transposase RayT
MLTRCGQIMREVCAGLGAELREFTGEHDHVRLRFLPALNGQDSSHIPC